MNTGIDFTGPLFVKEHGEAIKSYVCLFTCASTRAVHLELLKDLSLNMFLTAFRRFVSRRGMPRKILIDNAKTFKAAAKEVAMIYCSNNVKRYLADKGVSWHFIMERAPWHGGFWERLIKSTKRCLKKQIGRA
jgi:transposase InsO family protein